MTTRAENALSRAANRKWTPGRARYLLAVVLLILMPSVPAALAGQEPGDTVRVNGEHTGQFIRSDSAGLHFSFGFVPYGTVESLEIRVGTRSLWRSGMRHGAVYGAGSGTTLGLLVCAVDCSPNLLLAPVVMAAYGGGIGALIGAAMRRDRFDSVPVPVPGGRVEVSPGPLPRSVSIGYRLPIR